MKPRFVICIPGFNNKKTIEAVIQDCLQSTPFPILVVDDGSEDDIKGLTQLVNIASTRIIYLAHESNQGKGAALQTGFRYALENNFTHVLSISATGKYHAKELNKLAVASGLEPFSLIIGDRDLPPSKSINSNAFSKAFASFWAKYETDAQVSDSKCGFRCYPLFFLQNMQFFSQKYEFEIEVLIRLIWNGVGIKNIKIEVPFFPEGESPIQDSFKEKIRAASLNLVLVMVSLLTERTSPSKSATAISLGVFVGVLPVFGFHAVIVAGLALILRLNFIYLWIGSHISTPPLIPFLIYGSNLLGKKFYEHFNYNQDRVAVRFIVGSVILAVVLGLISFVAVYFIKTKLNQKEKSWDDQIQSPARDNFLKIILSRFGISTAYAFSYFFAIIRLLISFRTRKSINQFWKILRPELNFFQRRIQGFKQLVMFEKMLVDRISLQPIIRETKLSLKKTDFILTSHMGLWERSLNEAGEVAFIDRAHLENFEQRLFLKKLANFDTRAIVSALSTGKNIDFAVYLKSKTRTYEAYYLKPVITGIDYTSEAQLILNQYIQFLEDLIRRHPEQWFNFLPFWSRPLISINS